MRLEENKTAGHLMRERYFKIKNSRKISPEIIQILENYKKEYLKKHRQKKNCKKSTPAQTSRVGPFDETQ